MSRYRALFTARGFIGLLVGSVVARLPSGMFSLSILLFVHASTRSFLSAGVAVAAFTLAGAIAGPVLGALVDRHGQTRVLLPTATGQAAVLLALVAVGRGRPEAAAITAVAALAGACQPPTAGCVRALWREVVPDDGALDAAYALDASTQEIIWILGPLLVGSTAAFLSPSYAVVLCAAVTLLGTLYFAASNLSRSWRPTQHERPRGGALATPGFRPFLVTVLLAGAVIGSVEVGLPALATADGFHWAAGPLLAAFSLGSMLGGLLYSAARWRLPIAPRYRALLLAMTVAVAPLMVARSLGAALPLSFLAGLGLAPMLSAQFALVGTLCATSTLTEAFTWHRAAIIAGTAIGSALGGSLVDAHGTRATFAVGFAGLALAWLLAALWRAHIAQAGTRPQAVAADPAVL